jgi:uncharacterized metal-binding protein YceD (DUF177 family)
MPSPDAEIAARPVAVADLKPGRNAFSLSMNEAERKVIARRLGEPAVRRLDGEIVLTPFSGGVAAAIDVEAEVERICVSSLEPMTEIVREHFDLRFERDFSESDHEEEIDADILCEPLDGESIDLAELLIQHLSLSLVPYPRKAGAEALLESSRAAAIASPFADLKRLVDDGS